MKKSLDMLPGYVSIGEATLECILKKRDGKLTERDVDNIADMAFVNCRIDAARCRKPEEI